MIQALNYTDFLYRPRRPEELRTEEGGGIIFSQAVHQVDIVRLLGGGLARSVTAIAGAWDRSRPSEGAYSALMSFESGAFASLTYSGYAHFDSDIWMDDIGELGHKKDPDRYGAARKALAAVGSPEEEAALKSARTFGAAADLSSPDSHEHFGPTIALCDRADLRLSPLGVTI
jgi:phthalate 4,5-cis-dihydrodiol dehydrogenase